MMSNKFKIFFVAFLVSLPLWWGINIFQENLEGAFYAQISQPFYQAPEIKTPEKPEAPNLEIQAKAAASVMLNSADRQRILFEKNVNQLLPIASLTKLMNAVIVLEDPGYDMGNTLVTVTEEMANQENVPNYGNLDKYRGEMFNVEQLLDLMLIYSSNDAAFALSKVVGTENFVEKMNQKAEELGLENTHFVNPTGLDPENLHYHLPNQSYFNYSTARDLLKLSQYILKSQPSIFEISLKEGPYPIQNGLSNLRLDESQKFLGGKTGYTDEAGGCALLAFQKENGNVIINVILGAESPEARIKEMQKLINWSIK